MGGGCVYLKNRDQIINVGIIGHASTEDTRVSRCRYSFEVYDPQIAGNVQKFSTLPTPRYFVSF